MKIFVVAIPGDDAPITGASFDQRFCWDMYTKRKAELEEKGIAVTASMNECIHEVDVTGLTCLHLCIAGHYSDKEVVGAVIGDEDLHSMTSMMDRLNHQACHDDYFHLEDIMLGLPDVNKRNMNKYCVYLYKPTTKRDQGWRWANDKRFPKNQEEFDLLFKPKIELQTDCDTDEFWNFGASPHVIPKGYSEILCWRIPTLDEIIYRTEWCIELYAEDEDHALKIASDTLTAYLAKEEGIT